MKHSIRIALCTLALIGGTMAAQAQDAAPKGNAENGKALFTSYGCYQCHGTQGAGGSAGPALTPKPTVIPWNVFSGEVRKPVDQMPPYTTMVLSNEQLADIFAYTQTFPGPAPRSAAGTLLDR